MKIRQNMGVCLVALDKEGRVLVGKRKNAYKAGWWGLPGGRVEYGEKLKKAIKREMKEETGIEVEKVSWVGVVRETQEGWDFVHFVFKAENVNDEPEIKEPYKCAEWRWVEVKKLIKMPIIPGHLAGVRLIEGGEQLADLSKF